MPPMIQHAEFNTKLSYIQISSLLQYFKYGIWRNPDLIYLCSWWTLHTEKPQGMFTGRVIGLRFHLSYLSSKNLMAYISLLHMCPK